MRAAQCSVRWSDPLRMLSLAWWFLIHWGAAGLGEGKIRPWAGKLFSDGRDHVKQEKIHPGAFLREIKETKKFTGERNFFLSLCVYIIKSKFEGVQGRFETLS